MREARQKARTPERAKQLFEEYRREHPATELSPRDFLEAERPKTPSGAPKTPEDALLRERRQDIRQRRPTDLRGYPPDVQPRKLKPKHREEIKEYNLEVVGDDAVQAVDIARKVREGIERGADICKLSPPVCVGNKGLTRDKMPQIEGGKSVAEMLKSDDEGDRAKARAMVEAGADPDDDRPILAQLLAHLDRNGVGTSETSVSVGRLKATQKEIKAEKTFKMADAHLRGRFPGIGDTVVISRDGYVLDGHHRWAALMTIDPSRKMRVKVIDMDMDDLLAEAAAFPGVYRADFEGDPLAKDEQEKYKREHESRYKGRKKSAFVERVLGLARRNPKIMAALHREMKRVARDGRDLRSLQSRAAEFWQDLHHVLAHRWGMATKVKERAPYRYVVVRRDGESVLRYDLDGDEDGNFDVTVRLLDPSDRGGNKFVKALHEVRIGPSIDGLVDLVEKMTEKVVAG
jgi:hypothetical protein